MLATSGKLRIDQGYKVIGQEYHGKFAENASGETCQNCGLFITNIAIVEGSNDKTAYRIGLDCASTLTGINPCEIAQAKKELRFKAKFCKFIMTECKTIVKGEKDGQTWAYKKEVEKWESWFTWRWFSFERYMPMIEKAGIKVIYCNI